MDDMPPHWLTTFFDAITGPMSTVTPLGWTVIGVLAGLWLLKRFISARRNRAPKPAVPVNRTDRALLIGALFFVAIIFSSFAVGTFEGAKAFASDQLDWKTWMVAIPWGALDASTIGFSFFAVRAINRKRSPRKPMRVAMGTAGMSAIIQMVQGGKGHHWQAGMFLAFLAIMFGIALDVVIDQLRNPLEEIVETKKRIRPPFGLRWLTSPSTLPAWLAWVNDPPEDVEPTVPNALRHLEAIRAAKRARMTERPFWWFVQPWLYASRTERNAEQFRAEHDAFVAEHAEAERLAEQTHAAERSALEQKLATERSNTEQLALRSAEALRIAVEAERSKTTYETERFTALLRAERDARAADAERARTELATTVEQIRTEHAAAMAEQQRVLTEQLHAERTAVLRPQRSGAGRTTAPRSGGNHVGAERTGSGARLTDDEAIGAMLRAHAGADYDWGSREVNRITGAGFGRIPKLIAMIAEHHARSTGAPSADDDLERELAEMTG